MTLSLLVPMRGQPVRRELFLYTLRRTLRRTSCQLVIRLDDDDAETAAWVQTMAPDATVVVGPRYDGYASLPRFFNEMAQVATGDLLMCGNDDMRFETMDWVGHLLRAARRYPDGLCNLGVMTYPAGAVPFSCVGRRLVDALGFLNDERLLYSDIFLRDVHARLGRCELLPHVEILHIGVASHEAQAAKAGLDPVGYWRLHAACVEEAVAQLRPLMQRRSWFHLPRLDPVHV